MIRDVSVIIIKRPSSVDNIWNVRVLESVEVAG